MSQFHSFFYTHLHSRRANVEQHFSRAFVELLYQQSFITCMTVSGHTALWQRALKHSITSSIAVTSYTPPYIRIHTDATKKVYQTLTPWRKGPFAFNNFTIESEWNSSIKWQRLHKYMSFTGKTVLDVGAGNGYFSLLAALNGARSVVAVEPCMLFNYQFYTLWSTMSNQSQVHMFPIKLDDIATWQVAEFDLVMSMGVLYHHRSPLVHLQQLKHMLRSGGELLLETLYIEADNGYSLTPQGNYAHMPNVWFIPSIATLISWLKRLGFCNLSVLNTSTTSSKEQRATQWLADHPQSLADFLDKEHTLEGYPRPKRVMIVCTKP